MSKSKKRKENYNRQGDEELKKDDNVIKDEEVQNEIKSDEKIFEAEEIDRENGETFNELAIAKEAWEKEKEDLLDRIKRKQADIDNLMRISKNQQAETREYALQDFLTRLLPVMDNLERALYAAKDDATIPEAYVKGLEMIYNQIFQILEKEDVSVIDAVGAPFDPNCHHAVLQVESEESEPGTVTEELQKGYRYRQRILRPTMVKVCKE